MATRPTRRLLFVALAGGLTLVLAACSSTSNPSATTTTTTTSASTGSTNSAGAGSTTSTSSGTTVTSVTLAPETATATEFLSPSKNISCEIDFNFGPSAQSQTLCLTLSPARSVVLRTDGSLTECSGQSCLSNAGEGTPTLAYGQSITLGPFSCQSSAAGITCTLHMGAGFRIASSGVTPQGGATVAASATTG
jgi:hypothetical protein